KNCGYIYNFFCFCLFLTYRQKTIKINLHTFCNPSVSFIRLQLLPLYFMDIAGFTEESELYSTLLSIIYFMIENSRRWVRCLCTFAVAHKERNTNPDHDIKDIPTSLFTCIAAKVYMINTGELFCDAFTKAVKGITTNKAVIAYKTDDTIMSW